MKWQHVAFFEGKTVHKLEEGFVVCSFSALLLSFFLMMCVFIFLFD